MSLRTDWVYGTEENIANTQLKGEINGYAF
jgi:hypothetical protein